MIVLTDTIALDADAFDASGKLPRTSDGYAVLDCPVARSGIQEYLAAELGDAFRDRDPRSIVRVYRPDDVIFGDASLSSYAHKPLTNDHPPEQVTADNWKKYAIGHTGDEVRVENKRVRVPMLMADGAAIRDVESGKREWSAGYSVSFDVLPNGIAPDGTMADAIVTGQKINHIALVDKGRAGPDCRIGDNARRMTPEQKDRPMPHTMIVDGLQVPDVSDAAKVAIEKILADKAALASRVDAADAKVAELATTVAAKDAEIATLKQAVEDAKVTPAQLRDAAAAFAKVLTDAKRIAPDLKLADDADAATVVAAVVTHKLGDAAKGWTAAQYDTSFATMVASLPVNDAKADPIQRVIADGALNVSDAKKEYEDARKKRLAEMRGEKV
jgi:hypothetical protein